MKSNLLKGKTALVTGASRGIGQAIAVSLSQIGAEIIVNYSSSQEKANQVVNKIQALGGSAYSIKSDISNEHSVNNMISEAIDKSGTIDILINNAGITKDGLLMRMKTENWDDVINLNLKGVFLCTRAVSKFMLKQKSGRIINITSVVGIFGNAGQANYSASKAGVIGFTKSAAKEFASRGITVNAVAPGFIETDMTKSLNYEPIIAQIPLGKLGSVNDISGVVDFLASDPAAAYITGQTIRVDGGMGM
tara:strand:+ start:1395 stop:2141 length:747 start_codon:yes stop_codon:yes gene_type:complete